MKIDNRRFYFRFRSVRHGKYFRANASIQRLKIVLLEKIFVLFIASFSFLVEEEADRLTGDERKLFAEKVFHFSVKKNFLEKLCFSSFEGCSSVVEKRC